MGFAVTGSKRQMRIDKMKSKTSVNQQLIAVIKSYVQEWGAENVLISVPLEWERLSVVLRCDQTTRVAFASDGKITVSAFEHGLRRLHWEVDSQVVINELCRQAWT